MLWYWLTGTLQRNLNDNLIEFHLFAFRKIHWKMSSGKWHAFCPGLNVLNNLQLLQWWRCRKSISMLNFDYHSAMTFRSLIRIDFFENKISKSKYAFDWKSYLQRRAMDNIPSLISVTRNIVSDLNEPVQLNSMIASRVSREKQLLWRHHV